MKNYIIIMEIFKMNKKDKSDIMHLQSLALQGKINELLLFIKTIRLENDF